MTNISLPESGILVEAEAFENYGGWVVDSQFELEMGSPYLLAHGNGKPVADATTTISVPEAGEYNTWVRAKDWVPGYHPGRFTLAINETTLDTEFGANNKDWTWHFGGKVGLPPGKTSLRLRDLTGFCGRCDAIFFSKDNIPPPESVDDKARAWRRRFQGLPDEPVDVGSFDVVVVGGGVVGAAAALSAARLGDRVALVQNRPVLGGNGSVEVGLRPRGNTGPLVDELSDRHPNGDIRAKTLLDAEPTATVFLEYTVYNASTTNSAITSIDARHGRTGREIRLSATNFIDCSGRAILGLLSNAETLIGQESKSEYGESLAPSRRDDSHHGNTVFFRTRMASSPTTFPSVPWATAIAQDFSDLGGQLSKPGIENGEGPQVITTNHVANDPNIRRRMKMPLTHFWEYGNYLDMYTNGEHIRDHLLRAIYGTFSNVKTLEPEKYANLALDWVAFVAATGEFRRYKGDYVLTETDIRVHKAFPDGIVQNDGAFCLHYPHPRTDTQPSQHQDAMLDSKTELKTNQSKYTFRLSDWGWDERDHAPYDIPLRSLYSTSIQNLLMAGKHISTTHIAMSSTKFMGNGSSHAIGTACTAHVCRKHGVTPREVAGRDDLIAEVRGLVETIYIGKRKEQSKRDIRAATENLAEGWAVGLGESRRGRKRDSHL